MISLTVEHWPQAAVTTAGSLAVNLSLGHIVSVLLPRRGYTMMWSRKD